MPRYRCDNCGHVETDPPIAHNLQDRLDDGGVATTRECSECGALTYLIKTTTTYNHMLSLAFSVPGSTTCDPYSDLDAIMRGLEARVEDLKRLRSLGLDVEFMSSFLNEGDTVVEEIEEPV